VIKHRTVVIGSCLLLAVVIFIACTLSGTDRKTAWVLSTTGLMASLWITEAIPLGATSLLPIAIFPFAGIADVKEVAPLYASHIIFLFIAGFLLAFAMEKWNLHRRIAFKIIQLIGFSPKKMLLGFIMASFVLSMWINNTATTIVLLAPALAVIKEFPHGNKQQSFIGIALLLGICYASSIGGIVTPIGTAPNLILKAYYEESFTGMPELSFFSWMIFALPVATVMVIILYWYLSRKIGDLKSEGSIERLKERIKGIGRISFEESVILTVFILLIVLWFTAKDIEIGGTTIKGWTSWFENKAYIKDSAIGMLLAMTLFFIPAKNEGRNILEWDDAKKLPFDILFIFGGGFSIAKGFQITGLDERLGAYFDAAAGIPLLILILAVCFFMTFLTEITSNTATTQLILPLLIIMVNATGTDPRYLLVPATFSASFAFMLPVATPPNAIVFGTGMVPNKVMMRTGIWLNLIGIVVLTLYSYFFAEWF